jgi:nucleoside-diphosphate-sugar epimerase
MIRKVVITGPTGAIGMALINRCIHNNIQVIAVVNPKSKRKGQLLEHSLVTVVECDIEHYMSDDFISQIEQNSLYECDAWFHLAWMGASGPGRNDTDLQLRNIKGLLDAIELAKKIGCSTFVGAGSQAEYGLSDKPLRDNTPTNPYTGYGMAKLCAGQLGGLKARQLGIKYIWTRICSVYGPYDGENTMLISGIRSLLDGGVPKFTKGEQQWDYLYSEDGADILLRLAESGIDGRIYPIGRGVTRQLREYIDIMKCQVEEYVGHELMIELGAVPYGENQLMYLCADMSAVNEAIGIVNFTPFEVGIGKTIEWVGEKITNEEN